MTSFLLLLTAHRGYKQKVLWTGQAGSRTFSGMPQDTDAAGSCELHTYACDMQMPDLCQVACQ